MLSFRTHLGITAAIFAAILGLATIGNALQASGALPDSPGIKHAAIGVFFALVVALACSAVPIMVKLVLAAQIRAGNAGRPAIAWLIGHERAVVCAYWAIFALGLAVTLPAAIINGAFD